MKKNNAQTIFAILIVLLVGLLTFGGIFFLLKKKEVAKNQLIINKPVKSYGTITGKTFYKGKGVTIEYVVNKKNYTYKPSVSEQFYNKYNNGDTVEIVYFKDDPSVVQLRYRLCSAPKCCNDLKVEKK